MNKPTGQSQFVIYALLKNIFLPAFLIVAFAACQKEVLDKSLSLTFVNPENEEKEQKAVISYIDDFMIPHEEIVSTDMTIYPENTSRPFIDISYQAKNQNPRYYVLQPRDSAVFTMDKKNPTVAVINRATDSKTLNLENTLKTKLYNNKHTPLDDYLYYWNMLNDPAVKKIEVDMNQELLDLHKKALQSLFNEKAYLDTLKTDHVLLAYYQFKNRFDRERLALYRPDGIDFSDPGKVELVFNLDTWQDSTLNPAQFSFYYDFLNAYYQQYLSKTQGQTFDPIAEIDYLPTSAKEALVAIHYDALLNTSYTSDGKELLSAMDKKLPYHDHWAAHFIKKYNLDQLPGSQWKMLDMQGKDLTFGDLLRKTKGNMLYIDVWAGWCGPCVKAMPDSKELAAEYKDQAVSFVYLSIDETIEQWRKSSGRVLSHQPSESYFLDSLNRLKVMETFNISAIPRYMLFDQVGKLIDQDAPGPGTKEIRGLLNQVLN